jgi:hypothetical protein
MFLIFLEQLQGKLLINWQNISILLSGGLFLTKLTNSSWHIFLTKNYKNYIKK